MDQNRGPQVTTISITFLVLSWVTTVLRCYVRIFIVKHFGADDYLAVLTLATFSVFQVFVIWGVHYGTGQHTLDLPFENIPMALKQWFFAEIFYDIATTLTKFTIGVFLLRLSVRPTHTWIIRGVLGFITAYAIAYMFLIVFQCKPVAFFWLQYYALIPGYPVVPGGHCVRAIIVTTPTYIHTALNAIADWTLGILPVFIIKDLDMNPRTKGTVMVILALGAIGSVASIIRLRYISDLVSQDFLFDATDVAIWSTVEPGMGITAASLATLRPLFRSFLTSTRFFASWYTSSGSLSSRPSRASYARTGESKKLSTIYAPGSGKELLGSAFSPIGSPIEIKLQELEVGEGVRKIVQTQAHADEEEAQIRKKQMNKTVSWEKVRDPGKSRSMISIAIEELGDVETEALKGDGNMAAEGARIEAGKDKP